MLHALLASGWCPLTLGKRVLRAEFALHGVSALWLTDEDAARLLRQIRGRAVRRQVAERGTLAEAHRREMRETVARLARKAAALRVQLVEPDFVPHPAPRLGAGARIEVPGSADEPAEWAEPEPER